MTMRTSSLLSLGFGLFFPLRTSIRFEGILCHGTTYTSWVVEHSMELCVSEMVLGAHGYPDEDV